MSVHGDQRQVREAWNSAEGDAGAAVRLRTKMQSARVLRREPIEPVAMRRESGDALCSLHGLAGDEVLLKQPATPQIATPIPMTAKPPMIHPPVSILFQSQGLATC